MGGGFAAALESGDVRAVAAVPKSDLHNHTSNGGNVRMAGIPVPARPKWFAGIEAMEEWAHTYIKQYFPKPERYGAAFAQAAADGVAVLSMSFLSKELAMCPTVAEFITVIRDLKARFAPDIVFLPELSFFIGADIAYEEARLDELLPHGFFTSVDSAAKYTRRTRAGTSVSRAYTEGRARRITQATRYGRFLITACL